MAIPSDMANFLQQKYAILQQQADATTRNADTAALTGKAAANLDTVRAGLMPAESQANIGLTRANTGLTQANTRIAGINADYLPQILKGDIAYKTAQIGNLNVDTSGRLRDQREQPAVSFTTGGPAAGSDYVNSVLNSFRGLRMFGLGTGWGSSGGAISALELDRQNGL